MTTFGLVMRYLLDEEYNYNFVLIGISCHVKDYRLSWGINKQLGLRLEKDDRDLEIVAKNPLEASVHSLYSFFEEDTQNEYYLIANRSSQGYLIPEQRAADFLFMVQETYAVEVEKLVEQIKGVGFVLTAFVLEADKLKSKKNLIF